MKLTVPNCLTFLIVGAWIISLALRIVLPSWPAAQSLDTGVMLIIGYWFTAQGINRKNGTPKP
jgi:hypothetical protein